MEADIPRTHIFDELSHKARNGDKESQKLLDDIMDGKEFYIGKRKYRVVSL